MSKNLFNYQLNGVIDEQLAVVEEQHKEKVMSNPEIKSKHDRVNSDDPTVDDMEAALWMRGAMAGLGYVIESALKDSIDKCYHTDFKVG